MSLDRLKLLKENSVFWSKLGYCYDPPRQDADGKVILFASDLDRFTRIQKEFTNAGIKIVSSILFTGWIGNDQYDYELTDKILDSVFQADPEVFYIPRIKLNPPIEWCRENPEEVFVYYDGPRDAEGIRDIVGTDKHDILGYDAPNGYQNTFGYIDDRPNVGGKIALQSFSSQKWLKDAGEALTRLLRRLEDGPYAKQILAYHIAYGVCGETCIWGRFRKELPGDWGITNRKAFFDWGLKRYGSLENLRDNWSMPDLDRENAVPAVPETRKGPSASLQEILRGRPEDRINIDYELFSTDMNVDAMEYFGRIVKRNTDDKPVGYFYGYILECDNAGYSGWLGYDRILNSPCIDFIAAPKSYYRNCPGEPGGMLGPAQSLNRKKIWLDEIDNLTHLAPGSSCKSFSDTRYVLWREFAKNLAAGSNFWWMDLGGGWYDSPEIMREIGVMEKLAANLRKKPHHSRAQTLLIVDEYSLARLKCGTPLHHLLMLETVREFNLSGAMVDIFRLADLDSMDLSQYRLIVPLNTFSMGSFQWRKIKKRISDSAVVLWSYAPGVTADGFSIENIAKLTGFDVKEHPAERNVRIFFDALPSASWTFMSFDHPLPLLEITPRKGQKVIGMYSDGKAAMAIDGQSVYCIPPVLKAKHLRCIMDYAGCRFYGPEGSIVYGDNRFTAVFNVDNRAKFSFKLASAVDESSRTETNTIPIAQKIPQELNCV